MHKEDPSNQSPVNDLDSFLREAIESNDPDELLKAEKKIVYRDWENQTYIGDRIDTAFSAIDRRLAHFNSIKQDNAVQESNRLNRRIGYATIASVIVAMIVGFVQLWFQNIALNSEYRPYLGTYFSSENLIDASMTSSTNRLPGELAGCNYRDLSLSEDNASIVFNIPIKNYGKTPAKYRLQDLGVRSPSSTKYLAGSLLTIKEGYLMAGEHIYVRYQAPIKDVRVEPGFGVGNVDFVAPIIYQQLGRSVEYSSLISVKTKPIRSGSIEHCIEITNDLAK